MKNEFDGLINRLWADDSPILAYNFFELDHNGSMDTTWSNTKLRNNWTDFIIEIEPYEQEQICGYCGSESIGPFNNEE